MRKHTLNISLAAAMMLTPLLLACDSTAQGGSNTYVTVPDCGGAANQVLTTDATGQLACAPLPAGAVSLPDCGSDGTKALTSDGTNLTCSNLNTIDTSTQMLLDQLTSIEKSVTDYGTQLNKLGTAPGAQAVYVGLSSTMTMGRITSGALVGIPPAAALCATDYGVGAHMCSVYELYYSAALAQAGGKIDPTVDIEPGGWAYMQSWRLPVAAPTEMTAGLADNCGGYSDATTTSGWGGTRFHYATDLSNIRVPKFNATTLCNTSHPIACCR